MMSHIIRTLGILTAFFLGGVHCSSNESNLPDLISTNLSDVKFYLYFGESMDDYKEIIPWSIESLEASGYSKELPLKILVHGFMSNSTDEGGFVQRLKNAYIRTNTNANIMAMDWGPLSTVRDRLPLMPYYFRITQNVPRVGKYLAEMISFLLTFGGASVERIHIIGFSLGAHVSGIAGYHVQQNTSTSIARITGLDPAGPNFQGKSPVDRLDSTDAQFVDVTHTNQNENGYKGMLGHADFYPNGGGPKQPGCQNVTEPVKFLVGLCAHQFAYKLFEESILQSGNITACECETMFSMPCKTFDFNTKKCQNRVVWGDACSNTTRGEFYMKVALNDSELSLLDHIRNIELPDQILNSKIDPYLNITPFDGHGHQFEVSGFPNAWQALGFVTVPKSIASKKPITLIHEK